MKKFVGVALVGAAITLAPLSAFAGNDACHKHGSKKHCDMHHHEGRGGPHDEVIGVGAGALAGAVVAGPIGAVVGGVAGLFIVKHVD